MYGKPFLDTNAHLYACARAHAEMQAVASDETLSQLQRQLARQSADLLLALHRTFTESNNGQS